MNARLLVGLLTLALAGMVGQEPSARPLPPPMGTAPGHQASASSASPSTGKPHKAELRWAASTTGGIDGYYVYRAEGGLGAGYDRLTPKPIKEAHYTDLNVEAGKLYVYAVTTVRIVNSRAIESRFTPQVVVRIPKP
jgi:hypothetical protein